MRLKVERGRSPMKGKKRPAHWKPGGPQAMATVTLTEAYTDNGIRYGPGVVRVKATLAQAMQWTEDRIAEGRRRFLEPQDHLINIRYDGNGAQIISAQTVPQGYFDEGFDQTDVWRGHAAPAFHLRGPGR